MGCGDFEYLYSLDFPEKNCNKLMEVMSTQESGKRFSYRQIPGLTSLLSTLTAKKFMKMKISADKIYYNFFQENPKSTNVQNPHKPCRHFKKLITYS